MQAAEQLAAWRALQSSVASTTKQFVLARPPHLAEMRPSRAPTNTGARLWWIPWIPAWIPLAGVWIPWIPWIPAGGLENGKI